MELISEILDSWDNLTLDDKEYTLEILQKNTSQSKRDLLINRVETARSNYQKGLCRSGSVEDLFAEFDDD